MTQPQQKKMSLANVTSGRIQRPFMMALYGVDGVGKSTLAAGAPHPIFINAEDGSSELDVARFPGAENKAELEEAINVLLREEHGFNTVVLDSIDWAETMIRQDLCEQFRVESLEDVRGGFGKGTVALREQFVRFLDFLAYLRTYRDMNIIVIGHCEVKKFEDPTTAAGYDRYRIKLDEVNAARLREACDVVAFYNYDTALMAKENRQGEIQGKARGKSFDKHELHFKRSAAFDAKARTLNGYALPPKVIVPPDEPPGNSFRAFGHLIGITEPPIPGP
ncbi:ATP-binding protein [Methylomagnum ishizawai]|uniref:ATP-binding protein n=1 Tax=Methylomagnum ishizawai TaxID=1760988 RepID=UPI001C3337B8|nr:ATP-binding protein [Methylomagnum ishizawai]BBL75470.1 hypothetical protein MishRS11D_25680 [Methylomagnum ishizawai]